MKKAFAAIVVSALMVLSCSKEKESAQPAPIKVLNVLKTAPNAEAKKQIYSGMSPADKYSLWKLHFQFWLDSSVIKTDPAKTDLINELLSKLNAEIFKDESAAQAVFLNYTAPVWIEKAKKKFTEIEIFELTMVNYVSPIQANLYEEKPPGCFCHVGKTGYSCKKLSIGFPSGVKVDYGLCEYAQDCGYSRHGCGFLWLSSCNGSYCNF